MRQPGEVARRDFLAGDFFDQIHHQARVFGFIGEFFGQFGIIVPVDAAIDVGIKAVNASMIGLIAEYSLNPWALSQRR